MKCNVHVAVHVVQKIVHELPVAAGDWRGEFITFGPDSFVQEMTNADLNREIGELNAWLIRNVVPYLTRLQKRETWFCSIYSPLATAAKSLVVLYLDMETTRDIPSLPLY